MPDPATLRLYGIYALCAGGLVAGFVGLLGGYVHNSIRRWSLVACEIALLGVGTGLILFGYAASVGWSLLALGGILLFFTAARSDRVANTVGAIASRARAPRWQWCALAVGCLAMAGFLRLHSAAPTATPVAEKDPQEILEFPPLRFLPVNSAVTDQGHDVTLMTAMISDGSDEDLAAVENQELSRKGFLGRVIRTAGPDRTYNCHAWIFTETHCLIPDSTVETILEENGYKIVEKPAVGDLVVYRNLQGEVFHTAKVWGIGEDGQPMLESKWAWMGRFLHFPDVSPFGRNWKYYHTNRGGHILHSGLESHVETIKRPEAKSK